MVIHFYDTFVLVNEANENTINNHMLSTLNIKTRTIQHLIFFRKAHLLFETAGHYSP